jgi:hypothetical protein
MGEDLLRGVIEEGGTRAATQDGIPQKEPATAPAMLKCKFQKGALV